MRATALHAAASYCALHAVRLESKLKYCLQLSNSDERYSDGQHQPPPIDPQHQPTPPTCPNAVTVKIIKSN